MHVDMLEPIGPIDEITEVSRPHIRESDWTPTDTLNRRAGPRNTPYQDVMGYVLAAMILGTGLIVSSALLGIAWWLA